ncbi:four and a half LIM domains protein 2-like isoform X4 [Tachypleus tridentatus]|uniref:four and a half LIM domains protein 2-like isoform X4 n=1 Tax=Tachypleus tridentatus TaxID=6853 RepID=UPI003FD67F67
MMTSLVKRKKKKSKLNICNNCKCSRDAHDTVHEESVDVHQRLGAQTTQLQATNVQKIYSWVPPGLSKAKVEEYFAQLPNHKVPRVGTIGEKYRDKQLILQLPKQDLALAYCKFVEKDYSDTFDEFVNKRNEVALDIGYVKPALTKTLECFNCSGLILQEDVAVIAPKFGEDVAWHPACFTCSTCNELLVDLTYCLHEEAIFCERHYAEQLRPRCAACDEDMSYKDKHWHEACFLCNKCQASLVDKPFGSKAEKVYCSSCYDASFASRCDGCGNVFRAGTKKMEYKSRQWHEQCFCCCICQNPIGTKSFIPRDNEIYCTGCYEEKFATRCIKCNQIINSGGVTYKNDPWHRECFSCTNCDTCLAGQRFTSRDDKPYCSECFGELFAKRCIACSRPITGIGGTRFISFEDRNWHNECFICATCNACLVGKGFITDGPDILCPECAKQKLMETE